MDNRYLAIGLIAAVLLIGCAAIMVHNNTNSNTNIESDTNIDCDVANISFVVDEKKSSDVKAELRVLTPEEVAKLIEDLKKAESTAESASKAISSFSFAKCYRADVCKSIDAMKIDKEDVKESKKKPMKEKKAESTYDIKLGEDLMEL